MFNNLNARRGRLSSPIIVDLSLPEKDVFVDFKELRDLLTTKFHYKISPDNYKLDNQQMLDQIANFTLWRVERDKQVM